MTGLPCFEPSRLAAIGLRSSRSRARARSLSCLTFLCGLFLFWFVMFSAFDFSFILSNLYSVIYEQIYVFIWFLCLPLFLKFVQMTDLEKNELKLKVVNSAESLTLNGSIPRFAQTFTLKKYFTKITCLSKFRNI